MALPASTALNIPTYNSHNSCISSDETTAYYQLYGKIIAIRIMAYPGTQFRKLGTMKFIDDNGSRKLQMQVQARKKDENGAVPFKIETFMKYDKNCPDDKYAVSMMIRGNPINLTETSTKLASINCNGNMETSAAYVFRGKRREYSLHQGVEISTININGNDRIPEVGRNEVIDQRTDSVDESYHGDCRDIVFGIYVDGGHMRPPYEYRDDPSYESKSKRSMSMTKSRCRGRSGGSSGWEESKDFVYGDDRRGGGGGARSRGFGEEKEYTCGYDWKRGSSSENAGGQGDSEPNARDFRIAGGEIKERKWQSVSFKTAFKYLISCEIVIVPSSNNSVNVY